jgi:predicted outer membrane repeat protein
MNMRCHRAALAALGLVAACVGAPAAAATYAVGPIASGCTHVRLQDAVNAAEANPGADTIRMTRQGNWSAQQVVIDTAQDLDILGGFATCASTAPDGTPTTLSGAGGDARPVLRIRGSGVVRLRNLVIREGDPAGTDSGGGIDFIGGGILDIADTAIVDNSAYNGGGIFARGTTTAAEVVLGRNVTVQNNIARNDGGGVLANALEFSLVGPGSSILLNQALGQGGGGFGGGVLVFSDEFPAFGYIYSDGIGGVGAIFGNTAVHGGGVAVYGGRGSGRYATVNIYSVDPARPVLINQNSATQRGGAIYLDSDADTIAGDAIASANVQYADLVDNEAPEGAAAFLEEEGGAAFTTGSLAILTINAAPPSLPGGPAPCPTGRECGSLRGNVASPINGAVITGNRVAVIEARRLLVTGNSGRRLIEVRGNEESDIGGIGGDAQLRLYNSLITGNTVEALIDQPENSDAETFIGLVHVTIADNTISGPWVIRARDDLELKASIIWQPARPTLSGPSADPDILNVLSNDITHMPGGSGIVRAPRFIDPANDDYRLRAGSWGVDKAVFEPVRFDYQARRFALDGGLHEINLPGVGLDVALRFADMGAYERPAISPLVLNSDFDTGLNLWDEVGIDTTWTNTQNASGPPGSGSMRIGINPGSTQCITLPAPGTYRLNGWGRVTPAMLGQNRAVLRWQLRFDGGILGCREGTISGTGVHDLATDLNWRKPAQAAEIVVPEASFVAGSTSITIQPDAIGGGSSLPNAWFDGITLELDTAELFADGFE